MRFTVFPNPASGNAWLEMGGTMDHEDLGLEIVDALGNLVRAIPIRSGQARMMISTAGLADGLYLCRLRSGVQVLRAGRLVVAGGQE